MSLSWCSLSTGGEVISTLVLPEPNPFLHFHGDDSDESFEVDAAFPGFLHDTVAPKLAAAVKRAFDTRGSGEK